MKRSSREHGRSRVEVEGKDPWIETPQGGWFFVNALLVAPELTVLLPLAAGLLVSLLVPDREPSPFLDTIPFVASKAIPFLGMAPGDSHLDHRPEPSNGRASILPRVVLGGFLLLHLSFLGYTVWSWVG